MMEKRKEKKERKKTNKQAKNDRYFGTGTT